jgi:uncharacterized protein (DUF342 family)
MARPIEITPIIRGEDAKRFKLSLLQSLTMSYSKEEIERKKKKLKEMEESYQQFIKLTGGEF